MRSTLMVLARDPDSIVGSLVVRLPVARFLDATGHGSAKPAGLMESDLRAVSFRQLPVLGSLAQRLVDLVQQQLAPIGRRARCR